MGRDNVASLQGHCPPPTKHLSQSSGGTVQPQLRLQNSMSLICSCWLQALTTARAFHKQADSTCKACHAQTSCCPSTCRHIIQDHALPWQHGRHTTLDWRLLYTHSLVFALTRLAPAHWCKTHMARSAQALQDIQSLWHCLPCCLTHSSCLPAQSQFQARCLAGTLPSHSVAWYLDSQLMWVEYALSGSKAVGFCGKLNSLAICSLGKVKVLQSRMPCVQRAVMASVAAMPVTPVPSCGVC